MWCINHYFCLSANSYMDNTSTTLLRIILTGATGMVGEGVLHECLNAPQVQQILLLSPVAAPGATVEAIILPAGLA